MNPTDFKATIDRAKSLGLIRAPGQVKPVKLTGSEAAAINGVRITFMQITPDMARQWLAANLNNRHMRESTVVAYERDMRNGDWLLNHQGIAFDDAGVLIDGQHRLEALTRSGRTLTMLVSHGWPKKQTSQRNTTMDTVDRGLNRSVADQLGLQHGMTDARYAVSYAAVIAKLCSGQSKSIRMSTGLTLGVIGEFPAGLKFAVEHRNNLQGLRTSSVLGAVALSYELHPKKVAEFYDTLVTGIGLNKQHPVLHVRNWLTVGEGSSYTSGSAHFYAGCVVLNHIERFCKNETAEQICTSQAGLEYFAKALEPKIEAVKKLLMDLATTTKGQVSPVDSAT